MSSEAVLKKQLMKQLMSSKTALILKKQIKIAEFRLRGYEDFEAGKKTLHEHLNGKSKLSSEIVEAWQYGWREASKEMARKRKQRTAGHPAGGGDKGGPKKS